jgi:hypothetical protein
VVCAISYVPVVFLCVCESGTASSNALSAIFALSDGVLELFFQMLDLSLVVHEIAIATEVRVSNLARKFGSHCRHSLDDSHLQARVHLASDVHHVVYLLALHRPSYCILSRHSVGAL